MSCNLQSTDGDFQSPTDIWLRYQYQQHLPKSILKSPSVGVSHKFDANESTVLPSNDDNIRSRTLVPCDQDDKVIILSIVSVNFQCTLTLVIVNKHSSLSQILFCFQAFTAVITEKTSVSATAATLTDVHNNTPVTTPVTGVTHAATADTGARVSRFKASRMQSK